MTIEFRGILPATVKARRKQQRIAMLKVLKLKALKMETVWTILREVQRMMKTMSTI